VPYTVLFWFLSIAGGVAIGLVAPRYRASNVGIVFAIGVALFLSSIGFGRLWEYSWEEITSAVLFLHAEIPKYYWLARMCVVAYALMLGAFVFQVRIRLTNPEDTH